VSVWLNKGIDFGIISESGLPGVADPGTDIVRLAHHSGYKVSPLTGPSSITLALSASGMNGNSFAFNGYLPIKDGDLRSQLQVLEALIRKTGQTQIFIETPYRNNRIIKSILKHTKDHQISLCIALDLSGENESVQTMTLKQWKKTNPIELPKLPAIFLLGR